MKILLVAVLAIAAIATGMSGCEQNLTKDDKPVLEIPKGHRLKVKLNGKTDEKAVHDFEQLLLKHISPNGVTSINLRFRPDNSDGYTAADGYKEEEGPLPSTTGQFTPRPANTPVGPAGSMHNTQRIAFKTEADVAPVLDNLDASFNPTPTPKLSQ